MCTIFFSSSKIVLRTKRNKIATKQFILQVFLVCGTINKPERLQNRKKILHMPTKETGHWLVTLINDCGNDDGILIRQTRTEYHLV